MIDFDIYILFIFLISIFSVIILSYYSWDKFEIPVFLLVLTPWIHSVFFTNTTQWVNAEVETGPGGYARGIMLLFVGAFGLVKFFRRYKLEKGMIPLHLSLLGIFLVYSIISIIYSIDQRYTFIQVTFFASIFFFLLGLNSWLNEEENINKFLNTIFIAFTFLVVINLIALLVWPSRVWWWKAPSRFIGLFSHPSGIGELCMFFYPLILWRLYKKYNSQLIFIISLLVIVISLHFISGSRATIVASLIGIIIWFLFERNWIKLIQTSLVILLALFAVYQISPQSFVRTETSEITSLTERDAIWDATVLFAKEEPILGYGYKVEGKIFDNQRLMDIEGQFFNPSAQQPLHNGYLSIFIGGGIIGFVLWIIILLFPLYYLIKAPFTPLNGFILVIIVMVLVYNFVESALTGSGGLSDIFFWFAWVLSGKQFIKHKYDL